MPRNITSGPCRETALRRLEASSRRHSSICKACRRQCGLRRRRLVKRSDALKGPLIPADVNVEVTRDYGKTANDKANELLFHLALATVSIVLLIGFVIGWREAGVTLIVIPTTILLTLLAANLMGYTIDRVASSR